LTLDRASLQSAAFWKWFNPCSLLEKVNMKNKMTMSVWLGAAMAVGFVMGFASCGGDTMMLPSTCSSDSACATGEACHPVLKTCVTACTSGSDCPDSSKTCATLDGRTSSNDAGVRAFCQCSTDPLCERGTAGQVCQPATRVCAAKCTSSSSCPAGFSCDTVTGKCGAAVAVDGGADGGTDGGTGGTDAGVCAPGGCTVAGQICNPATSACGVAPTCAAANPQPDTCAYGLICGGTACAEAPRTGVTCANFANVATPKLWNPATVNPKGPVTVAMNSVAKDVVVVTINGEQNGFCGRANNAPRFADFTAEIVLYAGNTNFPAMRDLVPTNYFNYVRTDGQIIDVARNSMPLVRATGGYAMGLSNNNKNLTMRMNLCVSGTVPATLTAGFYSENGNAVCTDLN